MTIVVCPIWFPVAGQFRIFRDLPNCLFQFFQVSICRHEGPVKGIDVGSLRFFQSPVCFFLSIACKAQLREVGK